MPTQKQYQERKSVIAVDFDGVLHKYSRKWQDGVIYDEPMEGAVEATKELSKKFKVVVVTSRKQRGEIKKWLKRWGFDDYEVTNEKIPALTYIDDRAIRFTNWVDILNYFT